jgi:hypothetical protein
VTGTFGTVEAAGLTLGWDTDSPIGDGPADPGGRYILDGVSASWQTDVLPPVAQPSSVTFKVYQNGPDPGGSWLPWGIGEPITVTAHAYGTGGPTELFTFKGRVADNAGANHPAGGIVFEIICVDRLADLTSSNAPTPLDSTPITAADLFDIYIQIMVDADLDFDFQEGQSWVEPYWLDLIPLIDAENVTTFDALSTAITHDVRVNADPNVVDVVWTVDRWLCQKIDNGTTDPEPVARFRLNEWDPQAVDDLAGLAAFHWTGSVWTVLSNPDYYDDGGTGLVLAADQLARDVGAWRQTRDQAINTVELTSPTTFDTGAKTTRAQFDDLVALYGRNTRSVPCWYAERDDARAWGYELLIRRDQVQTDGYGFEQMVIAWETLTTDQLAAWGDQLWPRFGVAPLGRAFAVVDIPDHWRLATGPAVTGRVMSTTITLEDGVVRVLMGTRAIPPAAVDGVTFDNIAGFSPAQMTLNNIDPTLTIDDLAVVGPTTI